MAALHLVHIFSTFDAGGPQVRSCEIIKGLPAGYRHTICAMNGRYGAASRLPDDGTTQCRDLPLRSGKSFAWFKLIGHLRALKPDLILTYNWGAMDAVFAARLGRIAPIVHAEDGFGPEEAQRQFKRRVIARRLLLRRVSAVVVPSKTLERIALETWKLKPNMLHYVWNGIDGEEFCPGDKGLARSDLGLPKDALVLGSVGAFRAEKNHRLLVAAFATARLGPDVSLLLVGNGEKESELRQMAQELGVADSCVFAGRLENALAAYRAMDVFVLPSKSEQMPVALLEAMACGLPVVATDVGDVSIMLHEANRDFVCANADVNAFARALRRMCTDIGLRKEIGTKNREHSLACYPKAGMIARYDEIYRTAIKG